jgi:hypothetical protein
MTGPWAQYALYNRLANETLFEICSGLSEVEYRRDLGAFFGSVHSTRYVRRGRDWIGASNAFSKLYRTISNVAACVTSTMPASSRRIRCR